MCRPDYAFDPVVQIAFDAMGSEVGVSQELYLAASHAVLPLWNSLLKSSKSISSEPMWTPLLCHEVSGC